MMRYIILTYKLKYDLINVKANQCDLLRITKEKKIYE